MQVSLKSDEKKRVLYMTTNIQFNIVCTVHHIALCRRTNKMHKFLQTIFIFPMFLLVLNVSEEPTRPSLGALSIKLYHVVGTFVQASLAATWL